MSEYSEKGVSDNFSSGASYLISEANFDRFLAGGQKYLGRPDENADCVLFVSPSNEISEMIDKYPNSPRKWEEKLGVESHSLSDDVYRVNIDKPLDYHLEAPQKNSPGVNEFYLDITQEEGLPHTVGGLSEGVLFNADNPLVKSGIGDTSLICTSDSVRKEKAQLSFDNYVNAVIDKGKNDYTQIENRNDSCKMKILSNESEQKRMVRLKRNINR